jgi:hypothetical protein
MLSLGDHGKDHGLHGLDQRLLRFGCESELGAVEDCRCSSGASVSSDLPRALASRRDRECGVYCAGYPPIAARTARPPGLPA